jgi:two-component system chemotaxis response regulator CheB
VEFFIEDLIHKIKIASKATISANSSRMSNDEVQKTLSANINVSANKVIAIGASTGGTEAIYQVIKALPPTIPGIVITQHIPPVFSKMFADRLNNTTALSVKEAQTGDYIKPGCVLVAPGDLHMKIVRAGNNFRVECFRGEKVNGHCPSVDILFDSVAKEAGSQGIGIILTGMGYDGAKGLLAMKRKGARTIGQDKDTSVVYGMPRIAYELGAVEKQAALGNIPKLLCAMMG